jgi:hypothetical protein
MKSLSTEKTGKLLGKFNPNWSPFSEGAEEFPVAEMQAAKASCVLFTGRLLGRTSWTLDHSAGCGQSAFPLRELCAQPRALQHSPPLHD